MPINNTSITKVNEQHGIFLESVKGHLMKHLAIA